MTVLRRGNQLGGDKTGASRFYSDLHLQKKKKRKKAELRLQA